MLESRKRKLEGVTDIYPQSNWRERKRGQIENRMQYLNRYDKRMLPKIGPINIFLRDSASVSTLKQ